jgi:hypothetical protein
MEYYNYSIDKVTDIRTKLRTLMEFFVDFFFCDFVLTIVKKNYSSNDGYYAILSGYPVCFWVF